MRNSILHICFLVLFTYSAVAQTSNQGMLYVSEGTKFSTVERFNNQNTGSFYNDGDTFIYNHFNNDGIIDFYKNTGVTRFIGTSNQNISGTQVSYLYNAYFNNTSSTVPFQVSGDLNINGESNFYNGIVDNDNFGGEITFNTNAFHSNTSDYSHIDGPVIKRGDTDFIFPIGDGGYYRFAGISAPSGTSAFFESKYFLENSNTLYPHNSKTEVIELIDNQEYWTIKKESAAQENMLVTLSWHDSTTPQELIDAAADDLLIIVRWDAETNAWIDQGGAIDLANKTVTTAVNGYGVFTLASLKTDLVLTCKLEIYNAVSTSNDGNNNYFHIDSPSNECGRDFKVQIFNRWGIKVFETDNYGVGGDVFDGFSRGRLTVADSKKLPSGTYFYILDYQFGDTSENNRRKKAGYLYLN